MTSRDGAGFFVERRRGNGEELGLPAAELQFVEVQPAEGAVDGGVGGEVGDVPLGGADHALTSTGVKSANAVEGGWGG